MAIVTRTPPEDTSTNTHQSCSGISFKSQALYMLVYVTRYIGMPWILDNHLVALLVVA